MSERGSFVTECIGCLECVSRLLKVFDDSGEHIKVYTRDSNILAGFTGNSYPWGEVHNFTLFNFTPENAPCHPVRVAVIADNHGSAFLTILPTGKVREDVTFHGPHI